MINFLECYPNCSFHSFILEYIYFKCKQRQPQQKLLLKVAERRLRVVLLILELAWPSLILIKKFNGCIL